MALFLAVPAHADDSSSRKDSAAAACEVTEFPATPDPQTSPHSQGLIEAMPDGNMWFGEGNSIARILTAAPNTVTKFALPTPMGISNDVAAGPDGAYWFTEIIASKIGRIVPSAPSQIIEVPLTPGSAPDSIVAGPDGNLWFTVWSGHLARISPRAPYAVQKFPIKSGGIPHKVVVGRNGRLWFTDPLNNSVGRVTIRSGAAPLIEEFALPTANASPAGLAVGRGHDLWITEMQSGKIARLDDRTGAMLAEYPLAQGSSPTDVTLDRTGDVWFTEAGRNAIGRLHPPRLGQPPTISECALPATPYFLAAAPNGDIWFTEFHDPGIKIGRIQS